MPTKAALLAAIRDELKATIPGVQGRVYVVVEDAAGQLLPKEAACPFLTVADLGKPFTPQAGKVAVAEHQVRVRAYVQQWRDAEAPVLGHSGAAALQDQVLAALQYNPLAARLDGVEDVLPVSCPAVGTYLDEDWLAVTGDVVLKYTMEEDGA